MGVPKFFRYISERYPCLSEMVKEYQLPEFDNLYLDMNGIIHTCSHPDDGDPHFRITEEKIIADIFHYIEVLFRMIKPQRLFFMAIDGVAPRAKMNQQRGRRFRTAREALELEEKALAKGEKLPSEARFDSNCITPGTEFMAKLQEQLKYFVVSKISTDPLWQKCKIILSGHETPGEGEHKIMDYIRYMRAQPNYDPNTRHCLYGLDADLVMLGLCTHEPHFSLLREEVKFGKKSTKRKCVPEQITFFLLHLSLMREYLELEFLPLKKDLPFTYDFEHIIDDWVLMGFLVGNDFIPHLPNMHINSGALPLLYKAYMSVLPQLGGYINESGILNLERFEKFMKKLAEIDLEHFSDTYVDLKWFESKTGRQFSDKKHPLVPYDFEEEDEGKKENGVNKKDVPENWEDNSESETSDSDDDLFLAEFKQHKTDYYMNKLEYEDVTPEVLKSQAEGYVRAIQWNLHYYYNGVCSWSWYYPHHYAPYVSDIQGFKDLKLEFELGKPFKPFEQLLAVLPSASRNLLPTAYQSLMTAEDSPIKNYYPEQFETDLNGKKQEWEAVVLIPFIDEERLLEAMESCNEQLTPEEKRRNTPGPMLIYEHDIEGMGRYEAPAYFPPVEKAFFKCTTVSINEIRIPTEKLIKGAYPGLKMDVYYPGFPTLKHLKYTASIKKAKVKVFEQPSRGENMIVNIVQEEEGPSLDVLAKEMLGNVVYIAWPHLVEATVVSISNEQYRYVGTQAKGQYNVEENKGSTNFWKLQVNGITQYYANRLGINVGETKVLVHVKVMAGRKYVFTPQGRVNLEKQWADVESVYPLQTVVKNISVHEKKFAMYKSLGSVFPVGSKCFMLGQPYYGACGNVVESKDSLKNGRIQIVMMKIEEPDFTEAKRVAEELATRYMSLHVAAVKLSISKSLFSRITGCILIIPAGYREVTTEYSEMPKVNVGLNLKFNKKNEEIPGYTRKDANNWVYSEKALALVESYLQQFPILVEYLNKNGGNDVYFEEDIFPFGDGKEKLKEITTWIKKQPYYTIERQVCGSLTVDPDAVKKIEEIVGNFKKTAKAKKLTMQVKPHLLYMVGLQMGNIMPDPTTTFYLYDRVVNVRGSYTVPVGLKGTVVAIHKPPDAKDDDTMYDVLFDDTFTGGLQLNCSSPKAYRLPRSAMINITHGLRVLNKKTGFPGQLLQNLSLDPSKNTSNPRPNPSPNVPNNYYPPPAVNAAPYPNWGFPYSPVSNYGNFRPLQVYNNSNNSNVPLRNNVPYHPRPYGPPPVQGGAERYPIPPAPYPPSSRNNFMPMFGEKQQMKHNYYEQQQQWQSSYEPIPTSNKVKSSTTVTKESEQMPNRDQPKPPMPKVDTELLKKMLRINEVSNKQKQAPTVANKPEVVAAKIKDSTPLNLQDIFEHAKKKSQTVQDDDAFSFFTAKLLNYFKLRNLGCPRYQFFELSDDRFQAQIALPDGSVATGAIMDTKENAYESAAGEALKWLGVCAPQSTSSAPLREQNEIKSPLEINKKRYEKETKPDKEKNFVKIKPDLVEKKTKQQGNNKKVENDKGVVNKFVPLQAIRNKTKSTSKTNVDNNVAPSVSGPTTTNEKEEEKDRNEAEKNTTNQVSKNASSRRKRERKMRIAANFQVATNRK